MKRIGIAVVCLLAANTFYQNAQAQPRVTINIGAQPPWAPVGYNYAEYYYLPDIETYYYVPSKQYVYLDGPRWVYASNLPTKYVGYDIYRGYKVVINEPKPFLRHDVYKVKYQGYKGAYGKQVILRDKKSYKPGRRVGNPHVYGSGKAKSKGKAKGHDKGKGHN